MAASGGGVKFTSMPQVGERIGPYRIIGELGVGGMATVYRAEGPMGDVALKVLHPSRVTTEERKRFDREYLTLKRLSHPHVVRVFDAGVAGEHPYLALELVEGTDLGTLLERWEKNPPTDRFERVESLFRSICDALGYIHEQGLIHRDLKPGNILVSYSGVPKLSDFGVVKDTDHFNTSLTMVGRLVGTVAFMAPEQIMGEKVDSRADLYSLGAILYNLLTGKKAVQADSIAGYLSRHLSQAPRPPSELDPTIPRHLERVCLKLLEKDPARRYVSARQVLLALAAAPPTLLPIHGRTEELRQVQDRVRALVKEGVGGVVAVVGAHGSGRTRLLLEIAERGREQGLRSLMVGATPDALEQLLEGLPAAPAKGELSWRLMEGLGDTPTLLVVDDLDLAPSAVAEGLLQVLQQKLTMEAGPLLLVSSCLPEGVEPPARVVDAPASYGILSGVDTGLGVVVLRPGGLDREAVRGMLRDRGLGGGVGAVLGRRLQEELAGVPGLILEQLDALGAAGWVQKGPDGMLRALRPVESFRGSEPLPLPDRVRLVEARFLEQLPLLQREVVEAVAVLRGPAATPASVPLLLALTGASDGALQESLRLLERQGLLELREEGMEEVYSIPSARRAQVAIESMAPERRMLLHRVAALAMQQLYRRRLGAIAEVAAWHMIQGGDPAGAYPLLIQGAGRALRRGDTATARQLSQRALEARDAAEAALGPMEAAQLRRQLFTTLGDALRSSDRIDAAGDAYAQALLAARTEGDVASQGRALAGVGLVALARGRMPEAMGALEQAVVSLPQGEIVWPEAAMGLAILRFQRGDLGGMSRLLRQVQELGEAGGRACAIDALWGEVLLRRAAGDDPGARTLATSIQGQPADSRAAEAWVRLLRQRAELALFAGDTAEAMSLSDEIEELSEGYALATGAAVAGSLRVWALWQSGERAEAERLARELKEILTVGKGRLLGVWAPVVRALAVMGEGADLAPLFEDPSWPPDLPADTESLRLALFGLCAPIKGDAWEAARVLLRRPAAAVASVQARLELDAVRILLRTEDRAMARQVLEGLRDRLEPRAHKALLGELRALVGALGG